MTIAIRVSRDREELLEILKRPGLHELLGRVSGFIAEEFIVEGSTAYLIVEVVNGDTTTVAGLVTLRTATMRTCEIHFAILPEFWGTGTAHAFGTELTKILISRTPFRNVMTHIPISCVAQRKSFERFGGKEVGRIAGGAVVGDVVQDLILYNLKLQDK